jgi:hypothetical protein
MPSTEMSRARLDRLMEAARDARSAELKAGCARLLARLRRLLRSGGPAGRTHGA